jgi:hypothetical protein
MHIIFEHRTKIKTARIIDNGHIRRVSWTDKVPEAMFKNVFCNGTRVLWCGLAIGLSEQEQPNYGSRFGRLRIVYRMPGHAARLREYKLAFLHFAFGINVPTAYLNPFKGFEPEEAAHSAASVRGFVLTVECFK